MGWGDGGEEGGESGWVECERREGRREREGREGKTIWEGVSRVGEEEYERE